MKFPFYNYSLFEAGTCMKIPVMFFYVVVERLDHASYSQKLEIEAQDFMSKKTPES